MSELFYSIKYTSHFMSSGVFKTAPNAYKPFDCLAIHRWVGLNYIICEETVGLNDVLSVFCL